jgi:hypothetical protein
MHAAVYYAYIGIQMLFLKPHKNENKPKHI